MMHGQTQIKFIL